MQQIRIIISFGTAPKATLQVEGILLALITNTSLVVSVYKFMQILYKMS